VCGGKAAGDDLAGMDPGRLLKTAGRYSIKKKQTIHERTRNDSKLRPLSCRFVLFRGSFLVFQQPAGGTADLGLIENNGRTIVVLLQRDPGSELCFVHDVALIKATN
jgi:hypothetical protein